MSPTKFAWRKSKLERMTNMRASLSSLVVGIALACSTSSIAFADSYRPKAQPSTTSAQAVANTAASRELGRVMWTPQGKRVEGSLPKMGTGLGALPFFRGYGQTSVKGASATRLGFRWAGREKETSPIFDKGGKRVGVETRTVTRFLGRGTETILQQSATESSQSTYRMRQGLGGTKSWDAHSSSEAKVGAHTVRATASAKGGDNARVGMRSSGSAKSEVIEGTGKNARTVATGKSGASGTWD